MFFNINGNKHEGVNTSKYWEERNTVENLSELLINVAYVKSTLKEFLKSNKFIKYKDNGEDFIVLAPNSKFFKKYKNEKEINSYIKELLQEYLNTINADFGDIGKNICKFLTIDISEQSKPVLVTITI